MDLLENGHWWTAVPLAAHPPYTFPDGADRGSGLLLLLLLPRKQKNDKFGLFSGLSEP